MFLLLSDSLWTVSSARAPASCFSNISSLASPYKAGTRTLPSVLPRALPAAPPSSAAWWPLTRRQPLFPTQTQAPKSGQESASTLTATLRPSEARLFFFFFLFQAQRPHVPVRCCPLLAWWGNYTRLQKNIFVFQCFSTMLEVLPSNDQIIEPDDEQVKPLIHAGAGLTN